MDVRWTVSPHPRHEQLSMGYFWVDIDNPPQAQYLSPIARELRNRGHTVLVTSRNDEPTLAVLSNRGEAAIPVVGPFGASSLAKYSGTVWRVLRLLAIVRRRIGKPDAAISTSRSGVMAARLMGVHSFTILDYEGVEMGAFIKSGTTILHPDVVPAENFASRGFPPERLRSFPGIKEDIALIHLGPTHGDSRPRLFTPNESCASILIRPPSQTSHYRVDESIRVLDLLLDHLSSQDDLQVVFSPRSVEQIEMIRSREWALEAIVLERPVPVMDLLASVDHVITGGGTMLREAAWLGVPASTIFQGELSAVDAWLEAQGFVRRISAETDLSGLDWCESPQGKKMPHHPEAILKVLDEIESLA